MASYFKVGLSILGVFMAVWAWQNIDPLIGVIAGVLFIGGAGWTMVGGVLVKTLSSSGLLGRRAHLAYGPEGRESMAAWEERFGTINPRDIYTHPPRGSFEAWLADRREMGVDAGAWIDRNFPVPLREPVVQHVPLLQDGRGATFTINWFRGWDRHQVSWTYDEGVYEPPYQLAVDMEVRRAIAELEKELGLPPTSKPNE